MIKFIKPLIVISTVIFIISACANDDDRNNQDVFSGCCSQEAVFGSNVDNLNQSQGEIVVYNVITPNGDGINDLFVIENIELYSNHTVTIYNSSDNVIFESNNYGTPSNFFPSIQGSGENGPNGIPDGTYKYKIVVENEQTFLKSGTFCLFTDSMQPRSFIGCTSVSTFDPIISDL